MPPAWHIVFRILYRFLAALARLFVRSGRSKDLEIIVLRRHLQVLRRQIDRPELNDDDRNLLAAIAAALPRRLRQGCVVTPETLLRWHHRRIARHWTQPPTRPGGTGASTANSSDSATPSPLRPFGRSSKTTASTPHLNVLR